jgi:hypothetical protein
MDCHELADRQVTAKDLPKIEACLDRHRRERLQKDPFESADWFSSFCRLYPRTFGVAVAVAVLSASYDVFSGATRVVLASIFLLGLLAAGTAALGMLFRPLAQNVWRAFTGGTPVYDSLVARVAVSARTIADLQAFPRGALDVYRRALVIEYERLHGRQVMVWGTKISAVTAVLWMLKPAIDLSSGLGSITVDMSRVMSDPWLAPCGLLLMLVMVLLPRLHVEALKMQAEVLAAAIATAPSCAVPEVRASEDGAGAEHPMSGAAVPEAVEEHSSAVASDTISTDLSALGGRATRA